MSGNLRVLDDRLRGAIVVYEGVELAAPWHKAPGCPA